METAQRRNARRVILPGRALVDLRFDAKPRHWLALAALGLYADAQGWCFPKLRTLAAVIGVSKATMSTMVHDLERWHYLEIRPQQDEISGAQRVNRYRLLYDVDLPTEYDRSVGQSGVHGPFRFEPSEPPVQEPCGNAEGPVQGPLEEVNMERSSERAIVSKADPSAGSALSGSPVRRATSEHARHAKSVKAPPPPSVQAFRDERNAYPPRETWEEIVRAIGDAPDQIDFWHQVLRAYSAMGWNRQSVAGPLAFFAKGTLPAPSFGARQSGPRAESEARDAAIAAHLREKS